MAKNARQKKLEKRKAKSKSKQKQANLLKNLSAESHLMKSCRNSEFHACVIDYTGRDSGILNLLAARRSKEGGLVIAAFLIDSYCLGVKNGFIKHISTEEYEHMKSQRPFEDIKPEDAKKLLYDAVAWSKQIGFSPCKEYHTAIKIFDDVDHEASSMEFELGRDGEPLFIAGPNDSPAKCEKILKTLQNKNFIIGTDFGDVENSLLNDNFSASVEKHQNVLRIKRTFTV